MKFELVQCTGIRQCCDGIEESFEILELSDPEDMDQNLLQQSNIRVSLRLIYDFMEEIGEYCEVLERKYLPRDNPVLQNKVDGLLIRLYKAVFPDKTKKI